MFKPSKKDKLLHKLDELSRPFLANFRRRKLKNTDFTIISNNCWGGICYEYFGLIKQSPTVGTFFFAEDYLKFVKRLKYYLSLELRFINSDESKHSSYLKENEIKCPIGILDDVEIFFLHYPNELLAKEKWNRRVRRINWNHLLFKFSQMNECSDECLKKFDEMNLPGKKFMFVNKLNMEYSCSVYYPGYETDLQIENDTFFWNKYINVFDLINSSR